MVSKLSWERGREETREFQILNGDDPTRNCRHRHHFHIGSMSKSPWLFFENGHGIQKTPTWEEMEYMMSQLTSPSTFFRQVYTVHAVSSTICDFFSFACFVDTVALLSHNHTETRRGRREWFPLMWHNTRCTYIRAYFQASIHFIHSSPHSSPDAHSTTQYKKEINPLSAEIQVSWAITPKPSSFETWPINNMGFQSTLKQTEGFLTSSTFPHGFFLVGFSSSQYLNQRY